MGYVMSGPEGLVAGGPAAIVQAKGYRDVCTGCKGTKFKEMKDLSTLDVFVVCSDCFTVLKIQPYSSGLKQHPGSKEEYGYCPVCNERGVNRERRPNGNDMCVNSHTYPSKDALPAESKEVREDVPMTATQVNQTQSKPDPLFSLPEYQCHKKVKAAQIIGIKPLPDCCVLELKIRDETIFYEVSDSYRVKHNPDFGGYYVRYEDGYESYSPAAAFESGYRLMCDEIPMDVHKAREIVDAIPVNENAKVLEPPISYQVIARACHNINAEYCKAIGDDSQLTWCDAPDWQKQSACDGVRMHLDNPAAGPEQSHESWMRQKEADGWVYGDVKDPEKKQHPCIVPFSKLPVEQQAKDFIFRAVVHNFKRFV